MNYWLRKQAPVKKVVGPKTSWVPCKVEEHTQDLINLKIKNIQIEVTSGFEDELLLRILRVLERL